MNINRILLVIGEFLLFLNMSAQPMIKGELNKSLLPQPVYEANDGWVDLYWKAWELAWERVRYQEGIFQSPYMDENLQDDAIWIWDTEFMVLFCRYAPSVFPGIESLDNFYESILNGKSSSLRIHHPDNPPFFPWVEYEYYRMTGDKRRLKKVLLENRFLQRHYYWFDSLKRGHKMHFKHAWIALEKQDLGYKWGGIQSGMDNTPRGRSQKNEILWMDALAQQALAALYINRMAVELGEKDLAEEFIALYKEGKQILNKYYWNEEDGFYYDLLPVDTSYVKVRTPAVYWAMLAEIPSQKQAVRLARYANDSNEFGGKYPWPSVSRRDKEYNKEFGDYWKGAVWLPLAYMSTKALQKYGYYEIAYENSCKLLNQMYETYVACSPHTIWECYSPSTSSPAERIRKGGRVRVAPDFCGWSALGPISLFIESVLGFYRIDAVDKIVEWRKSGNFKQGIRNLRFGDIITDIIAVNGILEVKSNEAYTLVLNRQRYEVNKGNNFFNFDK